MTRESSPAVIGACSRPAHRPTAAQVLTSRSARSEAPADAGRPSSHGPCRCCVGSDWPVRQVRSVPNGTAVTPLHRVRSPIGHPRASDVAAPSRSTEECPSARARISTRLATSQASPSRAQYNGQNPAGSVTTRRRCGVASMTANCPSRARDSNPSASPAGTTTSPSSSATPSISRARSRDNSD